MLEVSGLGRGYFLRKAVRFYSGFFMVFLLFVVIYNLDVQG